MFKKIFVIALIVSILYTTGCNCSGCIGNKDWFDFDNNTFNYATIQLQDGTVVQGKVESWTDYDGEQLQVKIDGKTYLTSSYNCTLIYDPSIE